MAGFEAQDFTQDTLRDAKADLAAQGQIEGFGTDDMIQRLAQDSDLSADELSSISAELQYDVSDVCERSQELCSDLKDQIFISRLKSGISLSVNGSGSIMDEGLFQKHFGINIVQILEEHNGGWAARTSGYHELKIGDTFTAVLEGESITFFNGDNEAEFSYNVNTQEVSRDDLGENDVNDDTSVLDIDMEVDKVIEEGIKPFSGGTREALLDPTIRKDLSKLTDQEIITLSAEIGLEDHFLQSLKDGDRIVAHNIRSDEQMVKIAGLLSIQNPQDFVNYYRDRVNSGTPGSILITHNEGNVYLTDDKYVPYINFPRN